MFATAMGLTVLVRLIEGRSIAEPAFPLLIAAEAGAIAGLVAGYYYARSRADTRRARRIGDALHFVNDLLRHDLRNDLTVIQGYAELDDADRQSVTTDGRDGGSAVVAEKAEEALARIETTRAIAETLTEEPDLSTVDLAAMTAELAARTEGSRAVTVTTDLPDSAPVRSNAGLRSVVDNVLENAAEHNDSDNPRIAVTVATGADAVRLIVRDNGPGIPEERRSDLFAARGSDAGGLSGPDTGDRIRRRRPAPGRRVRGATFVVTLPRADGQAA